jgi:hypothetical protein
MAGAPSAATAGVPGLRREEVAQLAGVSTAYHTRMEPGYFRGVPGSVLRSLACALHMDNAETQHLFDLARSASQGARAPRAKPCPRLPQRADQPIEALPDVPVVALGSCARASFHPPLTMSCGSWPVADLCVLSGARPGCLYA